MTDQDQNQEAPAAETQTENPAPITSGEAQAPAAAPTYSAATEEKATDPAATIPGSAPTVSLATPANDQLTKAQAIKNHAHHLHAIFSSIENGGKEIEDALKKLFEAAEAGIKKVLA